MFSRLSISGLPGMKTGMFIRIHNLGGSKMLKKTYSKDGKNCKVTFRIEPNGAKKAYLCGNFTDWEKSGQPMRRLKDGSFSTSVTLKKGQEYYFRYMLDNGRWINDEAADAYVANPFGTEDSIVKV
jgi:1,4-alpha-glucan branching enzyme